MEKNEKDFSPNPFDRLIEPHVESFNWYLKHENMKKVVQGISSIVITLEEKQIRNYKISLEDITIAKYPTDNTGVKVFPSQARQSRSTYGIDFGLVVKLTDLSNSTEDLLINLKCGKMPLMVKSTRCCLHGLQGQQLVKLHEEHMEAGGYFIVNGIEKIIRLLIATKRNYPMAVVRNAWLKRGNSFSKYSIIIRSVRTDQSSSTNSMHYLTDGTASYRIIFQGTEYFIPLAILIKAIIDMSDREIYEAVTSGDPDNGFLCDSAELILRHTQQQKLFTRQQCLAYIGARFKPVASGYPNNWSALELADNILSNLVLPHLNSPRDKLNLIVLMFQKLYALVQGKISADVLDWPSNMEVLLPGQVYFGYLLKYIIQQKLIHWGNELVKYFGQTEKQKKKKFNQFSDGLIYIWDRFGGSSLGQKLTHFLATGNLTNNLAMDLTQFAGWTILAERLNWNRFISHFRSIHRGSFFQEMKTTSVRKLLPEAWGFLCPVHTPDGGPCGLLNHLTSSCSIPVEIDDTSQLESLCTSFGMTPLSQMERVPGNYLYVIVDGRVIGKIHTNKMHQLHNNLRWSKVNGDGRVPSTLEIALIAPSEAGLYPGVYMFSGPCRFTRPVRHLKTAKTEYVGAFEQVFLNIACIGDSLESKDSDELSPTHEELSPINFLSVVASCTPFSDFNQSPRNMYQCQMGKQTMGTPLYSYPYRADNKLYRIQTPQKPLVRTIAQDAYQMDEYPTGTNAVVAVISYTGYDMEDAMIINKSSYERGFGHGSVYKTQHIELNTKLAGSSRKYFCNKSEETGNKYFPQLDEDGLPIIGTRLKFGSLYYAFIDENGSPSSAKWKDKEDAYVEQVIIVAPDKKQPQDRIDFITVKLRYCRNPVIGDKFSSRHGQKGTMSRLFPQIDMPFSESGIVPDCLINPHAFPSRMTIGMLVESLAGKSGSLHGIFQDATPFKFDENKRAIDYFGEQLVKAGFNYYGNEPMYSGISGQELHADIYFGVVYYQRLRHMVKDKFQVRSTGPVNAITKQPIKGRKVGGGIRLGEMERDCLLAHGCSFLLHDRLFKCSDGSNQWVCSYCGSILAAHPVPASHWSTQKRTICRTCQTGDGIRIIELPVVFKYLAAELAAMNIQLTLEVQ